MLESDTIPDNVSILKMGMLTWKDPVTFGLLLERTGRRVVRKKKGFSAMLFWLTMQRSGNTRIRS